MKRLGSIVVVAVIAASPCAMLLPVWRSPTSAQEDDLVYFYPTRAMVGRALREGRWPLDNPREATGAVFMADPQAAVMFPPTWLFAAMEAKTAYRASIFLAFAAMGLGTYAYLRRLGLRVPAAAFGALAMEFCGFMVGHRVHLAVIHTAGMLPWGLWCIEGLRARPGETATPRRAPAVGTWLGLVAVVYLSVTAGHWPTVVHMTLVWGAYFLLRARPFWRSLAAAAGAAVLGGVLAAPQLHLGLRLFAGSTRQRIGYATAGENSFFPLSGVHALFPMLMGTRTPNFYPQRWWGAWHLCEMLGYVALVTLALAAACVWRLYRKPKPPRPSRREAVAGGARTLLFTCGDEYRPLVRTWTWLAVGAGVFMLGYYLPSYRLIHRLPVLGVVRCPARMLVAADMALVTLAAIWIHVLMGSRQEAATAKRLRTTRRAATLVLPALMAATLVGVAGGAWIVRRFWPGGVAGFGFFAGGAADALEAVRPWNPAVWVPLAAAAATCVVVRFWLARPGPRAPLLILLLLADLFFVAAFVDAPPGKEVQQNPDVSPAGAWLAQHAPDRRRYRIWGLSSSYHHRAAELLLPRTAQAMGFATINSYGPLHSPAHAHLFGFRIFGTARNWADLVRRNDLLSLYGVRYILAADRQHRDVLESVRIPRAAPPPDGPELIAGRWELKNADSRDGTLRLRTPFLWRFSEAWQPVTLKPQSVYRISLEARGPDGGAANFLQAEYFEKTETRYFADDAMRLIVDPERMGTDWRYFEWTFRTPRSFFGQTFLRLLTMSERPIEVRNVSLRRSHYCRARNLAGRLSPGEAVYVCRKELPPLNAGDPPVAIYENLLWQEAGKARGPGDPAAVEAFRRRLLRQPSGTEVPRPLPDVSLRVPADPRPTFWRATIPAAGAYALACLAAAALAWRARRRKRQ